MLLYASKFFQLVLEPLALQQRQLLSNIDVLFVGHGMSFTEFKVAPQA